jgi:hypothetical protein
MAQADPKEEARAGASAVFVLKPQRQYLKTHPKKVKKKKCSR